jgi:3-hydroxyisobutyrate dehydrogenase
MARMLKYPSMLCTAAEQVYFSAADKGYTSNDDAGLVRLWTSEPVSNIQCTLSQEDKDAKLDLVVSLLTGIHLVAAVESIAFAKHVGLPLQQLYQLAVEAAGGSAMFKEFGPKIISILEGKGGEDVGLESYLANLTGAVEEAQKIKCPVYLGSGALNMLVAASPGTKLSDLLRLYTVR